MSILISACIPEGIVLAGDSRQTYMNPRQSARVGSDFGNKVFQLTPRIGVTTFGWAFLIPPGSGLLTNIGALIEEFQATINPQITVVDAAVALSNHFQQIYQHDITALNWVPPAAGQLAFGFQVAGFSPNSTVGELYLCSIPPGTATPLLTTHNPGCNWQGQIDVISRLVLGVDPRIGNLPFAAHMAATPIPNQPPLGDQLNALQYQIQWNTMTLQDAVDFSILMVNSTISMQRFSDGIVGAPGDIPGCGGQIDVAVITNREGFRWIRKKELRATIE